MLFLVLTQVCRFFAIVFGMIPIVAIEAAPDHLLSYLLGSVLAFALAIQLFALSNRLETRWNNSFVATVINSIESENQKLA